MNEEDKDWRKIYPYTCKKCEKKRYTFILERAENELCTKCRREAVINENQKTIFDK